MSTPSTPCETLEAEVARLRAQVEALTAQVAKLTEKVCPPPTRFMTLEDWLER